MSVYTSDMKTSYRFSCSAFPIPGCYFCGLQWKIITFGQCDYALQPDELFCHQPVDLLTYNQYKHCVDIFFKPAETLTHGLNTDINMPLSS